MSRLVGSSHSAPMSDTDVGTLSACIAGRGHESKVFNITCFAFFFTRSFMNGLIVISNDVTEGSVEFGYHRKHKGVLDVTLATLIK